MSAFAQSSVTISGNVDLGLRNLKETLDSGVGASAVRKQSGPVGNGAAGWTSSALGLDIKEDLGNGTRAGYSAAMNLNSFGASADSANQQLGTGRHSYAFIGNNLGEARIGYLYTTDDQIQGGVGRATPTGNVGGRFQNYSFTSIPAGAGTQDFVSDYVTRTNGVELSTAAMNGFKGIVQWGRVKDEKTVTAQPVNGEANGKWQSVAATYNNGPLNLGASYATLDTDTATQNTALSVAGNKRKLATYAANYDLQVAKVFFNYTDRSNQASALSVDTNKSKTKGYDLGVSAPFGATKLFAAIGNGTFKADNAAGVTQFDVRVKTYMVGATYDLSKRTSFNAYYSNMKATDQEIGATDSLKKTNIGAGLRHQF